MRRSSFFSFAALLLAAATTARGDSDSDPLVVTASNTAQNQLLVYDTANHLVQTLSTQGQGGVSSNAGGISAHDGVIAVVNFGSKSVSVFRRDRNRFQMTQSIPTASNPVSVAFGHDHLYVLGTTQVESHRMNDSNIHASPDGVVLLLKADGSSAQVGVVADHLIITEKSNVIETVNLLDDGAVTGVASLVQNIPTNVNVPFGLVTRGNNAYVTIAHADEIGLVRGGSVLTVTGSGTEHSPCWLTLVGPFLFSSNSPSKTVSRFAVYGQKIVQDAAVAAQFQGAPTDIASGNRLVGVIDSSGALSHLSLFHVDEDGNLTLKSVATINAPANGIAIVGSEKEKYD
jgi:hypothetical protein